MKTLPRVALIIESTASYGRGLIRGAVRYSRMHGPWFFPWVFYNDDLGFLELMHKHADLDYLRRWHPDGIIARDAKDIGKLTHLNIPLFVSVGRNTPDPHMNIISTDDPTIGRMAAEHLLDRGFRHFGFCGFDHMVWSRCRSESFRNRIAEAGFQTSIYKQPKSRAAREWDKEEIILMNWLRSLPKPVGIMACNDRRGQHITIRYLFLVVIAIHIPGDVSYWNYDVTTTLEKSTDGGNTPNSETIQNNIYVNVQDVPEPATFLILRLGAVMLRRKHS